MKKGRFYTIIVKCDDRNITNIVTVFVANGEGNIQDICEEQIKSIKSYFGVEDEALTTRVEEGLPIEFNLCHQGEDYFKNSARGYKTISSVVI